MRNEEIQQQISEWLNWIRDVIQFPSLIESLCSCRNQGAVGLEIDKSPRCRLTVLTELYVKKTAEMIVGGIRHLS